jgi:putative tryptophan/tyrosine transport system substrate-binding protein
VISFPTLQGVTPVEGPVAISIARRKFIAALGGVAVAWPTAARAQQPVSRLIGYLESGAQAERANLVAAFRHGLTETGYVEGQNLTIEYRWADNQYDRLPALAADLVRRQVAVIATVASTPAAVAAKAATATIPIVYSGGGDPVQLGLAASLNRPGGNVTGITSMNAGLGAKRLGLLRELLPGIARFAVLVNPNSPITEPFVTDVRAAAGAIGLPIEILAAGTNSEIDAAFASLVQNRADALLVSPDVLFINRRVQLATLAVRHAVPTIYPFREDAEAGGLMSYGSSITDLARQVGVYTGRILKGEKPADLPISRATKFEFVINLQTAKLLGLNIPSSLLATADAVIE